MKLCNSKQGWRWGCGEVDQCHPPVPTENRQIGANGIVWGSNISYGHPRLSRRKIRQWILLTKEVLQLGFGEALLRERHIRISARRKIPSWFLCWLLDGLKLPRLLLWWIRGKTNRYPGLVLPVRGRGSQVDRRCIVIYYSEQAPSPKSGVVWGYRGQKACSWCTRLYKRFY